MKCEKPSKPNTQMKLTSTKQRMKKTALAEDDTNEVKIHKRETS